MFDVDTFIADCVACLDETDPRRAAREVLERALADSPSVVNALQPDIGGIKLLYNTPEMTVINVVWAPGMQLYPHNHEMWALIGVYTGQEDNEFFRRNPDGPGLVPSNGKSLGQGDIAAMGTETIHAVSNPLRQLTGGIHIYGGDFVKQPRSMWEPPDNAEVPYDSSVVDRLFREADARWLEERKN